MKHYKKKLMMMTVTLLMVFGVFVTTMTPTTQSASADDNLGTWIFCRDEPGVDIYNTKATSLLLYQLRSKSAAVTMDGVKNFYNSVLGVAGFDFVEVNELILGREINPSSLTEVSTEESNANAPKVSAFDRFGMAGLNWSSYLGEWKYYNVNACVKQSEVSPVNYGDFYQGRLEPQSTADEAANSADIRTQQFNKGFGSAWLTVQTNMLTNFIFAIAKVIVTLTITFVGLAFTDITSLLGFGVSGVTESGASAAGIFTTLYNGIFSNFILFTFLFTAIYIFYQGVIKRQARMAINSLGKTVLIFLVAVIMATNPAYWISIPNKVATYGQALVLNSMTGLFEDGDGEGSLCSTNVSSIYDGTNIDGAVGEDALLSEMEQISHNMKSIIGCKMWEQFLFIPWAQGQFGVDYKELDADKLGNTNGDWVGDAPVPLGAGTYHNNWALFQLSTQTDVHAQLGDNNFPTYINGVNADWWRVVDALSNYNEEEKTVTGSLIGNESVDVSYTDPSDGEPLPYWQFWVGNNTAERSGQAFIAVAFGILGSVTPLVLSVSSAVFGLGITFLMMVSPPFLLLGTWGGKGEQIFNGWLSALANTIIKRVAISFLMVLSISITLSVMRLIYIIGVVKAFILLAIITLVLVKNKDTLLEMMASVNFGGSFDPRRGFNQAIDKQKRAAKDVGNIGVAAAVGASVGHKTGRGMREGARIGAAHQTRNTLFKSQVGINVIMAYEGKENSLDTTGYACAICYRTFETTTQDVVAFRDDNGNFYCESCGDEMGSENLYTITLSNNNKLQGNEEKKTVFVDEYGVEIAPENIKESDIEGVDYFIKEVVTRTSTEATKLRTNVATLNKSWMSHGATHKVMDMTYKNKELHWNNDNVKGMIERNLNDLERDTVVFINNIRVLGIAASPPSIPEPLHNYIDLALINDAWTKGQHTHIQETYKQAWKSWYQDNAEVVHGISDDEIKEFQEEIDNMEFDIEEKEVEALMESYTKIQSHKDNGSLEREQALYIKKNGKIVLNKTIDRRQNIANNSTGNDKNNNSK